MDTIAVNILEDTDSFIYYFKLIAPYSGIIGAIIGATIGSYLAYIFAIKKERKIDGEKENKKFNTLKSHVIFSIDELIKSTRSQIQYIDDFKVQFKNEEMDLKDIHVNASFDIENFNAIPKLDYYELFIGRSNQQKDKKSKAFSNLNFCLKVTKQVSENLVPDMNKYRKRINELYEPLNRYTSYLRKISNVILKDESLSDPGFIEEMNNLNKEVYKTEKLNDIFYMFEKYHKPLLELAKKYNVLLLIQLIPDGIGVYKQIIGTREQFYSIYQNFIKQMEESINELENIKSFLKSDG